MRRAGALAMLLGGACLGKGPPAEPHPPPGEVWLTGVQADRMGLRTEAVAEHLVGGTITTGGKVAFDDRRATRVMSPVTGRVTHIEAEPGARVARGAPLAVISSPDVGSAFSDLAKADADWRAARSQAQRQHDLFQFGAGSRRDVEEADAEAARTDAERDRALKKVRLLRAGQAAAGEDYTLRAPIDGEVVARNVNPGMEVQGLYAGGSGSELFTVGELDNVWVLADVYEQDLARVTVGADVAVTVVAYPGRTFHGRADWISPTLDATTRTAKVRCPIANPDHALKPEMYATVSIAVAKRRALAVSRAAVLRVGGTNVVFVERGPAPGGGRRFAVQPVGLGADGTGDLVPVVRGVAAGDRVVASGAILLSGKL